MKRSSIIKLSALIAAAALLLVVFLILKDRKENPKDPTETTTAFTVMTIDADSTTKIEIRNADYEAVFEKTADGWYNPNDIANPVIFEGLINDFLKKLKALAKIENPASYTEYGLENPTGTFTAYAGDKKLVCIMIGDKIPTKDQYYCRFEGDNSVYAVSNSYAHYMLRDRTYYTSRVKLPSVSGIKYLSEITVEGTLFKEFHAVKNVENPFDYSGRKLLYWLIDKPYRAAAEADTITGSWLTQLERYLNIYCDEMRPARPEEFAAYGLSNPAAKLTVRYTNEAGTEESSYTILIGNRKEDGSYYAKLQGMDVLLTMSENNVLGMCDVDVFANTYATLFFPTYTTLAKIEIETVTDLYVLEHRKVEDTDEFLFNGNTIDSTMMSDWSTNALRLTATAYRPVDTPTTDPYLTVRIEVLDKEKMQDSVIRFFRNGDGFDTVERHGVCDFVIDSRSVDGFINYMKGMQGE